MDPDVIKVLTYVFVAVVIGMYVAFVVWRVRVDRAKKAPAEQKTLQEQPLAPGAPPPPRPPQPAKVSRAERKAAAMAGTTPVLRGDLSASEARVLAAAARIAGRDPDAAAPADTTPADTTPSDTTPSDTTPSDTTPSDTTRHVPDAAEGRATALAAAPAAATGASLFRPAVPATPSPTADSGDRATSVAALLSGIDLPCDLVPLTQMADRMSTLDRIAFSTTTATAETVAPAFASELERLGFTITPEGYDSLVISRGADRGVVVVHPVADEAVIEGKPAFPAALPRTVVVEIWIPVGAL